MPTILQGIEHEMKSTINNILSGKSKFKIKRKIITSNKIKTTFQIKQLFLIYLHVR